MQMQWLMTSYTQPKLYQLYKQSYRGQFATQTLKLGGLIVLQETHLGLQKKFCYHGNSLFSTPHQLDLKDVSDFQLENCLTRPQTRDNIFICLLDNANMKVECQRWPEKPLILEKSGAQYVSIVTRLLSSYSGSHSVKSYSKESNISDKIG